jgi:hypothetical protein
MKASRLLPPAPMEYRGSPLSVYFLALVAMVSTVRSLIHILAPDGGAGSIAGLALDASTGVNLVAIFAQWGASQLLLSVFYWLALLRYRFLVPFMLAVVALKQVLRIGVGVLKPFQVASPPPGAVGSHILLPLSLVALGLALRRGQDDEA